MRLRYSLSLLLLLLLIVLVVVPLLASARRATGHAFHGHHRRLRSSSPSLGTKGVVEDGNHQLLKNGARLRHLHERNQPCDLRPQQPQQQPTAGGREGKVRRGYFVMPSSAAAAGGNSAGFGFGSALPSIGMMSTLSASWQQLQQQLSAQVEEGEADLEKREKDDFLAKGLERLSAAPSAIVSAVGYAGYYDEEEGEGEEGEEWIEEEEWLDDLLDMDYFDDIPEEEEQEQEEQEGNEEEKEEEEEENAELLSTPSPRSDDPALLTVNNDDNEAEEEPVVDSAAGDRSAGTGWWSFTNSWDMLSYESGEAEAAEAEQENVSKNRLVECRVPNDCAHVEGRPICMHNKALNMTVCSECDPTRGFKDCQCDASRYCVSDPLDPKQGSCRKYEESILGRPCDENVNGRTTELGKDDLLYCGQALYNPKTNHIRVVEWEGSCQRGTCYLCGEGPVSIAAISICPDARICLAGRYAYAPVGIFSWIYLNRNPVLSMTFVVTCLFIAVVIVGTLGGVCYVCIALARGNPHRWRRVPTTQPEMVF
ncbi:Retrotransposon Gag like 5 [Balamuthia mandrillaris]